MATYQLKASMAPVVVLPNMYLRLEAIDPTTGNAVGGVTCDNWAIYGDPTPDDSGFDVKSLAPLLTYEPI